MAANTRVSKTDARRAFRDLFAAMPPQDVVEELLDRKPTQAEAEALSNMEARFRPMTSTWTPQAVTWPGFFEPKVLACGHKQDGRSTHPMVAITPRGVAVEVQLGAEKANADRFVLTGLSNYPPVISASWASNLIADGMTLVSQVGDLLHCPKTRQGGQWPCAPLANAPRRVPLAEGSKLAAAAVAWLGAAKPQLHAAVILENSPDMVALWALEGNTEAASWIPLGELPVPLKKTSGFAVKPSLTFVNDGELLLATPDGATIQRRIIDGSVVKSTPAFEFAAEKKPTLQWQAACGLHGTNGGVAHLSLRRRENTNTGRPEVMITNMLTSA